MWEDLPSNRIINTTQKSEIRIYEKWGHVETKEDYVPKILTNNVGQLKTPELLQPAKMQTLKSQESEMTTMVSELNRTPI